MSKIIRVLVTLIIFTVLLVPSALAFEQNFSPTNHSYSVSELSTYSCAGSTRHRSSMNGVVRVRTTMSWNDQDAQNARNDAQNGSYYTHDITDMNDNLDGWCIWTNFPSPYYDWDDDGDSIFKWEESEVVSVDTNFPPANINYSVNSYFTRWTE